MIKNILRALRGEAAPIARTTAAIEAYDAMAHGVTAFSAGDYASAETAFRDALRAAPNDGRSAFHLAATLCAVDRLMEAAPLAWAAYSSDRQSADYIGCMRFICCNLHSPASDHGNDVWALVAKGNSLRAGGRFDEAERLYRSALEQMPENVFLRCRVGVALCNRFHFGEASHFFSNAAEAGLMPEGMLDFTSERLQRLATDSAWTQGSEKIVSSLPDRIDGEIVFLLSCDPVYFARHAAALVNSMGRNAGIWCAIHFHVINPSPETFSLFQSLEGRYANIQLVLTHETMDLAVLAMPKIAYACARFLLLPALIRHYRRPVMILDIDALAVRNLGALVNTLSQHSVAIPLVDQGRGEPTEMLWAALAYFNNDTTGETLSALVANYILDEIDLGHSYWFIDQAALLGMLAYSHTSRHGDVFLLPESVMLSTEHPVVEEGKQEGIEGCFWTLAASIPAHLARLEHPSFKAYCD